MTKQQVVLEALRAILRYGSKKTYSPSKIRLLQKEARKLLTK